MHSLDNHDRKLATSVSNKNKNSGKRNYNATLIFVEIMEFVFVRVTVLEVTNAEIHIPCSTVLLFLALRIVDDCFLTTLKFDLPLESPDHTQRGFGHILGDIANVIRGATSGFHIKKAHCRQMEEKEDLGLVLTQ